MTNLQKTANESMNVNQLTHVQANNAKIKMKLYLVWALMLNSQRLQIFMGRREVRRC